MQILEVSGLGLRAAKHRLESPDSPITVTLFPMVHIGEKRFFDQVYADAFSHDVVLVESVRSPVVQHLTSSYRWIEHADLGLVTQPYYPAQETVSAHMIHADLSGEEFHDEWRKVPIWIRLAAYALAPVIGLNRRLFATRESIASQMGMEDMLSRDEILSWNPDIEALRYSILGARDARLIEYLRLQLAQAPSQGRRLAIVFGARHMRAVLAEMVGRNFFSAESEWQTVFSFGVGDP
ncbi:MAG: hypothetical protein GY789_28110 [Hyphomicrobiales bacterium]|nr:hypothetical protein [Hyphomicrobiales bacterium]